MRKAQLHRAPGGHSKRHPCSQGNASTVCECCDLCGRSMAIQTLGGFGKEASVRSVDGEYGFRHWFGQGLQRRAALILWLAVGRPDLSCAAYAYDFKVGYRAHYDGPVSDINVLRKTDRKFVSAVVSAVSRWRFKPWDVSYQKTGSCSSGRRSSTTTGSTPSGGSGAATGPTPSGRSSTSVGPASG